MKKQDNNIKSIQEVLGIQRYDVSEVKKIEDLVGEDVIIYDYKVVQGEYGEYAVVLSSLDGSDKKFVFTTGGTVVKKKLQMCKDKNAFPVRCKIVRVKRYYDLI